MPDVTVAVPQAVDTVIPAAAVTELAVSGATMVDSTSGIPGPTGPAGPTGIVKATHGSDPNFARPSAVLVYWVGTVQPLNAQPDDLLMLK